MTLTQLRTFALVARLGSLRAAAAELGVSEPAVSAALAALRTDLDDPLFVRAGGGIRLTPGGRALAVHAREIVGLAERARREVSHAATARGRLRVLATPAFEEHVAGPLVDAFTRRVPGAAVEVIGGSADDLTPALLDDACDIALGARPAVAAGALVEAMPFLRYRRVVVAAPGHPLATAGRPVPLGELAAERWVSGPAGIEVGTAEARWLADQPRTPEFVRCLSETDALAEVRAGTGLLLALGHVVAAGLAAGRLVVVPVQGTPVEGMWWASTLGGRRSTTAARQLQDFLTTPAATSAMVARPPRSPRARPTVRVALWSQDQARPEPPRGAEGAVLPQ